VQQLLQQQQQHLCNLKLHRPAEALTVLHSRKYTPGTVRICPQPIACSTATCVPISHCAFMLYYNRRAACCLVVLCVYLQPIVCTTATCVLRNNAFTYVPQNQRAACCLVVLCAFLRLLHIAAGRLCALSSGATGPRHTCTGQTIGTLSPAAGGLLTC
jgi:hypothetical protein